MYSSHMGKETSFKSSLYIRRIELNWNTYIRPAYLKSKEIPGMHVNRSLWISLLIFLFLPLHPNVLPSTNMFRYVTDYRSLRYKIYIYDTLIIQCTHAPSSGIFFSPHSFLAVIFPIMFELLILIILNVFVSQVLHL